MSMQVTCLEQTQSCMILTSEDPESSVPLRIVTEELASEYCKNKISQTVFLCLHVRNDVHVSTKIGVLTQDSRTIQLWDFCNKRFEMSEGHFVHSLDKALGGMNVHRQAYYGGTFIGNHVRKCLKVSNYNHAAIITINQNLWTFFPPTARECTRTLHSTAHLCTAILSSPYSHCTVYLQKPWKSYCTILRLPSNIQQCRKNDQHRCWCFGYELHTCTILILA